MRNSALGWGRGLVPSVAVGWSRAQAPRFALLPEVLGRRTNLRLPLRCGPEPLGALALVPVAVDLPARRR